MMGYADYMLPEDYPDDPLFAESVAPMPQHCSHQWRDRTVGQQLVGNKPIAPYEMQKGKVYICLTCKRELRP